MELLKEKQIVRHNDGTFGIVEITSQIQMGAQLIGEIKMISHGFTTYGQALSQLDILEMNNDN